MKSIQNQLQEVKAKLDSYQEIPSNINLAQLKIESLAKEIVILFKLEIKFIL